jgi:hypothetical protein
MYDAEMDEGRKRVVGIMAADSSGSVLMVLLVEGAAADEGGDPHRHRKSMSARMPGAGRCHDRRRPAVRRYSAGARFRHLVDWRFPTKTAHPRASSPEDLP